MSARKCCTCCHNGSSTPKEFLLKRRNCCRIRLSTIKQHLLRVLALQALQEVQEVQKALDLLEALDPLEALDADTERVSDSDSEVDA